MVNGTFPKDPRAEIFAQWDPANGESCRPVAWQGITYLIDIY
jgi:hypothetical protein